MGRICIACGVEKDLSDFYKGNRECKPCYNDRRNSKIRKGPPTGRRNKKYNSETRKDAKKQYNKTYKDKHKEDDKAYRIKNRERQRKYNDKYLAKNANARIAKNLRIRIYGILRDFGLKKELHYKDLIGCSPKQLASYIEAQFTKGMTWDNYGKNGWHIDHIRPCSSFDMSDINQQRECFHYSNLRPLWWWENLSKGDKWDNKE